MREVRLGRRAGARGALHEPVLLVRTKIFLKGHMGLSAQKHNTRPAYESTSPPESTLVQSTLVHLLLGMGCTYVQTLSQRRSGLSKTQYDMRPAPTCYDESASPPESTLVPLVALPPSPPALGDRSPPPSDFMLWSSSSNCACSLLSASRRGALWARRGRGHDHKSCRRQESAIRGCYIGGALGTA